ncbi:MAG: redoxin domain-containing protein [Deltaproteobacteria bacterium]|nr:redoxin domain-containing protein [Deltaproteobacteria bacterium]
MRPTRIGMLLGLLALCSAALCMRPRHTGNTPIGKTAPDFSLADTEGRIVTLRELRDRGSTALVFYLGDW